MYVVNISKKIKMNKTKQPVGQSIKVADSQMILETTYESLIQEAQNASYLGYSIEQLSAGKFGIVELGEKINFVILSDRLYTQDPLYSIGWAYGLGQFGTFSFEPQTGVRHETCRIVSIENTTTEMALKRYNYFIKAISKDSLKPTIVNKEFIDGLWFAVQYMVVVRDIPAIAIEVIKEANFTVVDCEDAQKRNGAFNTQMQKFITERLK